jgi:hypothetical protein
MLGKMPPKLRAHCPLKKMIASGILKFRQKFAINSLEAKKFSSFAGKID